MTRTLIFASTTLLLLGSAYAGEPVVLSPEELDDVVAGEGGWSSDQLSSRNGDRGGLGDGEHAPSPYYFEGASAHNVTDASANAGNGTGVGGKATSGGSVGKGSI